MIFANLFFILHCEWQYINNLTEKNVMILRKFSAISAAIFQIYKVSTKFKSFEKSNKILLEDKLHEKGSVYTF